MKDVFVVADNIVSPLGFSSADNFRQLTEGISGIQQHNNIAIAPEPFYASLFAPQTTFIEAPASYTKFEQLLIASIAGALQHCPVDIKSPSTALIISTTKGNISLIETEPVTPALKERVALYTSAQLVAGHFGFTTQPLIVSHACISGVLAITTGMRLLRSGQYRHVVIAGADVITRFVLSGFQSFQAVSAAPCKPFDAARNGVTLGEGAATIVLSVDPPANATAHIRVTGGAVSNDANHISGPSRTGQELFQAMQRTMHEAGVAATDIDFISAHGTATLYNDEMESKAITLAGLQDVPVNSLKGYYGHTLGAAGLIESVISIHSLLQNLVIPTKGFSEPGTTKSLNVCSILQPGFLKTCLKTASGFGGCNAAVLFNKQLI